MRLRIFLTVALLLPLAACGTSEDPRPNLVLISIDTLRADALGAYGSAAPTPRFDALAAGGVLAEVAVAPAPETAPSHVTLFSGRSVLLHGVTRGGVVLPRVEMLAGALQAEGYATGAFVSSFVLDPRFGWSRGFDHYDARFDPARATVQLPGRRSRGLDRRAADTNAAAREWLASAPRPFFLFVHYFDPHSPYEPPSDFEHGLAAHPVDLRDRSFPGLSRMELARKIRGYLAEVRYVDGQLGDLVDAVHAHSPPEDSLIVVTSDHGEGLGQHEWLDHASNLHEEQVRVPLLWFWPGTLEPGRISTPLGLVDVAPTTAELLAVPFESGGDGRSVAPALLEGREPRHRPILGHRRDRVELPRLEVKPGRQDSVRTARWKYIRMERGEDELYDLSTDPGELRNVHDQHPEVVSELSDELDVYLSFVEVGETPVLDEDTRRKLEALGYVD